MGYRTGSQHLVWAISEPVTRSRGLGPAEGSALGSPAPLVRSHPFPAASGRRRRTESFSSGGTTRAAPQRSVWPAAGAALRGGRRSRSHGSSRGHEAQERAPRPGVQPRAGRAAARGQPVGNAEARQARPAGSAGGRRPRQVRGPPDPPASAQARAPPAGAGQRSASTAARGRCTRPRPENVPTARRRSPRRGPARPPQGHLAGRGKPSEGPSVRSGEGEAKCGQGACAVRRHKRLRGSPGHAR